MRRVAVIGPPGTGKSTLSRRLAQITGLPLIHLDRLFWSEGWVSTPRDQWEREVRRMVAGDEWIIDGNYASTLGIRLEVADTVILLDLPRSIYIRRVITRMLRAFIRRETRPDLASGCPERPDANFFRFLHYVWGFHQSGRPGLLRYLDDLPTGTTLLWLRGPREIKGMISEAERSRG